MPFYLVWGQNTNMLKGFDGQNWVEGQLTFPISFPGDVSDPQFFSLQSSAAKNQTFETLIGVGFYLIGADVAAVQGEWPYLGNSYSPARPDFNGGIEISFDGGLSWIRFTTTAGWKADRSTWIPLPEIALGAAGLAGQLSPYDIASLTIRYVLPPNLSMNKVLDVQLAVGFEIA